MTEKRELQLFYLVLRGDITLIYLLDIVLVNLGRVQYAEELALLVERHINKFDHWILLLVYMIVVSLVCIDNSLHLISTEVMIICKAIEKKYVI